MYSSVGLLEPAELDPFRIGERYTVGKAFLSLLELELDWGRRRGPGTLTRGRRVLDSLAFSLTYEAPAPLLANSSLIARQRVASSPSLNPRFWSAYSAPARLGNSLARPLARQNLHRLAPC